MTAQQRCECSLSPCTPEQPHLATACGWADVQHHLGQGIPPELSAGASRVTELLPLSLLIKSPRGSACWSAGPAGCGLQWISAQAQRAPSQGGCASKSPENISPGVTGTGTQRDRAQGGMHMEQNLCLCLLVSALDSAGFPGT